MVFSETQQYIEPNFYQSRQNSYPRLYNAIALFQSSPWNINTAWRMQKHAHKNTYFIWVSDQISDVHFWMVTLCITEVGALLHSWRQRTVFVSDTVKKSAQSKHTRNQQEPVYHCKTITSASTEEKVWGVWKKQRLSEPGAQTCCNSNKDTHTSELPTQRRL